ncbi:MAG: 2-oxoacid:acceptor oxidoreductase family protein [Thermosphaera sp.]
MKTEIIIVGRGGQGVLLMGRVLGLAASKYAGLYVVSTESYASETRGGESRAEVIIASEMGEIDYLKVQNPNIAVFMYPFRLDQYLKILGRESLVFIDNQIVPEDRFTGLNVKSQPYSRIAESIGSQRVTNMVILGHMLRKTSIMDVSYVEEAVKESVPEKWIELNIKALRKGYSLPA